jgi:carbamoyl-phosphate synthase large subunit
VGRGARGVELYRTEREIPAALPRGRIYQEFLSGDEFDVNVFADAPGVPAVVVVLRKSALKFGDFGNAAAVERVEDREVGALAEAAVRSLSLEGPLDVDVRRGASGKPAILEINGRLGANVRSAEEVLDRMTASWRERQ